MRDIPGYEGLYAATSCGKIWSHKSKKFLSPSNWKGYLKVCLRKDGKTITCRVHRLIALAYLPNPLNLSQVNHKDEDTTHNWINNLEWCSAKYNTNYGLRNEKVSKALSKPFICVETGEIFENTLAAQNKLNIDASNIRKVLRGERKTAGKLMFKYL